MVDFSGEGSVSVSGSSCQGFLGIMYATAKGIDLKQLTNRVGVLSANPTKKALLGKA